MNVVIRQATLRDRVRIGEFIHLAYQERAAYKYPERWQWEFVDNPFFPGDGLPIWLAEINGEIVGQVCSMFVPLKLGDKVLAAGWGADLIVLPEFRKLGIGAALLQAQVEYQDVLLAVVLSSITRKGLLCMGLDDAETVTQMGKTIRFESIDAGKIIDTWFGRIGPVSKLLRRVGVESIVAGFLTLNGRFCDARHLRKAEANQIVEEIDFFGTDIDQLWNRLAPKFSVMVQRDSSYLNWKFIQQPFMEYRKFILRQDGQVNGYVITRRGVAPEPPVGVIADVFCDPHDEVSFQVLLSHAVKSLKKEGVNSILAATASPSWIERYAHFGFKEIQQLTPVLQCKPVTGRVQKDFLDGWFMSMGDHDWDQFPLL